MPSVNAAKMSHNAGIAKGFFVFGLRLKTRLSVLKIGQRCQKD